MDYMSNNKQADSFAARMKTYEAVAAPNLLIRTPVIVRVDGKNFSKLTRSMQKPFDRRLVQCMEAAANRLLQEAQNCRLAYHQSDEISLLLTDFKNLNTSPWFDNQVQKISSISAALATAGFCEEFIRQFPELARERSLPVFDARCFNLPREEVTNYFVWRQRDAERNSVSMAAQSVFSHRSLHGMNRTQMLDMLMLQKGINWNDYDAVFKRGQVMVKQLVKSTVESSGVLSVRSKWVTEPAPIFSKERDFIEKFMRDEEVRV